MPVNSILMSSSGLSPESRIRSLARSTIFTGSPISRTQIWPPCPITAACSTSWHASGMVIKKRRNVGMRHRYRSARRDLLFEDGNDATVGAQHVAEAHGDVLGTSVLH